MSLAENFNPIQVTTSEQIELDHNGALRSSRFNDVYFYPDRGVDESEYVFIQGNNLNERWQALKKPNNTATHFVIAELGFGTGLNFLVCAEYWLNCFAQLHEPNCEQPTPMLYYYSIEKYPLTPAALKKVYAELGVNFALSTALLEKYPDPVSSDYCLTFKLQTCNIVLILLFGDGINGLERLEHTAYLHKPACNHSQNPLQTPPPGFHVDAWFLDGFAPNKNAAMWSTPITESMARLSNTRTSLATFSVARSVRDNLQQAGFALKKKPGFAHKRDMLTGQFAGSPSPTTTRPSTADYRACYNRFTALDTKPTKTIAIIGAGIAGCCTAYHLAELGYQVSIFDSHSQPTQAASGNNKAILFARTAKQRSSLSDLHEACYHYAKSFYASLGAKELTHGLQGMLKLGASLPEALSQNPELSSRRQLDQQQASSIAGASLRDGGLFYPDSGFLQPEKLSAALLTHNNIQFYGSTTISQIQHDGQQWQLDYQQTRAQNTSAHMDQIIICAGHLSHQFEVCNWLPIKPIRGQTTQINATEKSLQLNITVCDKGYITPAQNDTHECGATFTLDCNSPALRCEDQQKNLQQLVDAFSDDMQWNPSEQPLTGKVGFRATSPDYIPIAGPVSAVEIFNQQYSALRKNAKCTPNEPAQLIKGLYVNAGYGSHGFTLAPLVSYILAAQIHQSPLPIGDSLRTALAPNRFLLRALIKNKKL